MAKIFKDEYGLFARSDGSIIRPIKDEGIFEENEKVTAYHYGGTCWHRISGGNKKDFWYSHGSYTSKKEKVFDEKIEKFTHLLVELKYMRRRANYAYMET